MSALLRASSSNQNALVGVPAVSALSPRGRARPIARAASRAGAGPVVVLCECNNPSCRRSIELPATSSIPLRCPWCLSWEW